MRHSFKKTVPEGGLPFGTKSNCYAAGGDFSAVRWNVLLHWYCLVSWTDSEEESVSPNYTGGQGDDVVEASQQNSRLSSSGIHTDEELESARDLIALKNYGLYSEDNQILERFVVNVISRLNAFLEKYDEFRFNVKRNRLLFHGHIVHEGPPDSGNMAFILFRDGIRWVMFQKGIYMAEVAGFLTILNRHKEIPEEFEGDLVTAMWEAQFSQ